MVRDLRVVCLVIDPAPNGVARLHLHLHASEAPAAEHEVACFGRWLMVSQELQIDGARGRITTFGLVED